MRKFRSGAGHKTRLDLNKNAATGPIFVHHGLVQLSWVGLPKMVIDMQGQGTHSTRLGEKSVDKASSVAETKNQESRPSGAFPKASAENRPGTNQGESGGAFAQGRLTSAESGVFSGLTQPMATEQLLERLQSALGVASKGESDLGVMQDALQDSTKALATSRQSHQALAEELRVLYRGLNELLSEKAGLERYAALLTQERDAALSSATQVRREAQTERQFLLDEQDRFIRLLMEEHEAELAQVGAVSSESTASLAALGGASAVLAEAVVEEIESFSSSPILPPNVAVDELSLSKKSQISGDWDPQDWAVSTRLMKDEPVARQLLDRRSSGEALQEYPEEMSIHEEPTQPLMAHTMVNSAAVARVRLEKVSASGVQTLRSQSAADFRGNTIPVDAPPAEATPLELDSVAEEVDGNSDRPPPVRRLETGLGELVLPKNSDPSKLMDTLVSGLPDEPGTESKG